MSGPELFAGCVAMSETAVDTDAGLPGVGTEVVSWQWQNERLAVCAGCMKGKYTLVLQFKTPDHAWIVGVVEAIMTAYNIVPDMPALRLQVCEHDDNPVYIPHVHYTFNMARVGQHATHHIAVLHVPVAPGAATGCVVHEANQVMLLITHAPPLWHISTYTGLLPAVRAVPSPGLLPGVEVAPPIRTVTSPGYLHVAYIHQHMSPRGVGLKLWGAEEGSYLVLYPVPELLAPAPPPPA